MKIIFTYTKRKFKHNILIYDLFCLLMDKWTFFYPNNDKTLLWPSWDLKLFSRQSKLWLKTMSCQCFAKSCNFCHRAFQIKRELWNSKRFIQILWCQIQIRKIRVIENSILELDRRNKNDKWRKSRKSSKYKILPTEVLYAPQSSYNARHVCE